MCLACVLNDHEVESRSNFQDGVHVDGPAVEVHGDDCRNRLTRNSMDKSARARVNHALRLRIVQQFLRIHCVAARVDIHKVGASARLRNRFGCGDER